MSSFEVPGLRVRLGVFVSGKESSLVARRVWTCCACRANGDRRRNVACVLGCAEVRGLPARQIKSGWFPADDVDCSTTAWSIVSVSLNLHDLNKSSGRTAPTRARLPAGVPTRRVARQYCSLRKMYLLT